MKKILLVINSLTRGGAEHQCALLAIALKNAGNDVRLIYFDDADKDYRGLLEANGVTPHLLPAGKNKLRRVTVILSQIRIFRPDTVISFLNSSNVATGLARMIKKFRFIPSERNTSVSLSLKERLKFALYHRADFIVSNSHSQKRFIESNYPKLGNKTHVITNAIDTERFHPSNSKQKKSLIVCARIMPQKNVVRFLKALALLKSSDSIPFPVHWFGHGDDPEYLAKVKHTVRTLQLHEDIIFHEPIDDIENQYRRATHFCLPSLYEGFPNALCEAMASGLVCTASYVCDNPDIIPHREMLFDPNDIENMAEILRKSIALNEAECKRIGDENRKRAISIGSTDIFLKKYLSLIN